MWDGHPQNPATHSKMTSLRAVCLAGMRSQEPYEPAQCKRGMQSEKAHLDIQAFARAVQGPVSGAGSWLSFLSTTEAPALPGPVAPRALLPVQSLRVGGSSALPLLCFCPFTLAALMLFESRALPRPSSCSGNLHIGSSPWKLNAAPSPRCFFEFPSRYYAFC